MSGYGSWGSGKKSKKVWTSSSGWERSHFGGHNRLIWDYPLIKSDFNMQIELDEKLRKDQGVWTGEKLVKIFLMKAKENASVMEYLYSHAEVTTKKNIIGREEQFVRIPISIPVIDSVMRSSPEFAPLFVHYREQLSNCALTMEVPKGGGGGGQGEGENEEENDHQGGQGQGDGEGEEQEGEGQGKDKGDGEGEDQEGGGGQGQGDGDGDGDDSEDSENDSKGDGEGKPKEAKGGGWGSSEKSTLEKLKQSIEEMKEQQAFSPWKSFAGDAKPKFVPVQNNKYTGEYRFTESEKQNGELLIKKLDISFEPKSDVVKNLKMGSLDVSKIAEVPAGNVSIYKQTLEDQDTKPFAVCVLADMSGSMEGSRLNTQFKVLNALYLALSEIIPVDDLHIYGHSGSSSEPEIYTFCNPYHPEYSKNINRYYSIYNNSNYDGIVIEAVHKKIREKTDNPVILISISDGQPCDDIQNMKKILERARRDQFVTVGIGIGTDYVKELYNYSRVVWDHKIEEMPKEVADIINHVVRSEFK